MHRHLNQGLVIPWIDAFQSEVAGIYRKEAWLPFRNASLQLRSRLGHILCLYTAMPPVPPDDAMCDGMRKVEQCAHVIVCSQSQKCGWPAVCLASENFSYRAIYDLWM